MYVKFVVIYIIFITQIGMRALYTRQSPANMDMYTYYVLYLY